MKTITQRRLNTLIKKSEGDWDFLMYQLKEYWKKTKSPKQEVKKLVQSMGGDPYCCGDEYFDGRNGRR